MKKAYTLPIEKAKYVVAIQTQMTQMALRALRLCVKDEGFVRNQGAREQRSQATLEQPKSAGRAELPLVANFEHAAPAEIPQSSPRLSQNR